jgi:hypothetical protein
MPVGAAAMVPAMCCFESLQNAATRLTGDAATFGLNWILLLLR